MGLNLFFPPPPPLSFELCRTIPPPNQIKSGVTPLLIEFCFLHPQLNNFFAPPPPNWIFFFQTPNSIIYFVPLPIFFFFNKYQNCFSPQMLQDVNDEFVFPGFLLFSKYQIPGFLKVFGPKFQGFSRFFVPNSRYFHTNFSYKNLEMC